MKVLSILTGKLKALVAPLLPSAFADLFFFAGLIAINYGVWLIYKPLGFIVGGGIGILLATLIYGSEKR